MASVLSSTNLSGGELEESRRIGLPRRTGRKVEELGARVHGERRERAVGTVEQSGVATQVAEGDSHDESQAGGDEVAHRSDLGSFGGHAAGLWIDTGERKKRQACGAAAST